MDMLMIRKGKKTLVNFFDFFRPGTAAPRRVRRPGVFISHAWEYGMEYILVLELLYSVHNFQWHNCSTPKFDPPGDPGLDLINEYLPGLLKKQIGGAHCVLIISDMYARNSYWIQKQMEFSRELGKPIIAIRSRSLSSLADNVRDMANAVVEWNAQSVVQAIRSFAS
jgi:hypothetical protein